MVTVVQHPLPLFHPYVDKIAAKLSVLDNLLPYYESHVAAILIIILKIS